MSPHDAVGALHFRYHGAFAFNVIEVEFRSVCVHTVPITELRAYVTAQT